MGWWSSSIRRWRQWFVSTNIQNWEKLIDPLLLAIREVPQASTGFFSFELLYWQRGSRGISNLLKETWEESPSQTRNEIECVLDLQVKLYLIGQISRLKNVGDGNTTGGYNCKYSNRGKKMSWEPEFLIWLKLVRSHFTAIWLWNSRRR